MERGTADEVDGEEARSLDPSDFDDYRRLAHEVLDHCLNFLRSAHERRTWTPVPDAVKQALSAPAPLLPEGRRAFEDALRLVLPYTTGNVHPRFFGWVHGTGTVGGILSAMLTAAMNANVGGRDHGAIYVERQVVDWFRDLFGFPLGASGLLVSGTSMATLIGLAVARSSVHGVDVRADGARALPPLRIYASTEAHVSVTKAVELLGLGRNAIRWVPVDDGFRMRVDALRSAIESDQQTGIRPLCVVATAGTVNTGAFDDLVGTAALCREHGTWLHVDGAFGALARLSPRLALLVNGIDQADSLAFDFHKWLHVPYDAGCILVQRGGAHFDTFSTHPAYLTAAPRGLAGGQPWPCDFGPELSRELRGLKIWLTLKEHGIRRLARKIEDNCDQARLLGERITRTPELELAAQVSLNIVCFRFVAPGMSPVQLDALNEDITGDLQESGIAVASTTELRGRRVMRVAITNHRTRERDLDVVVDAVLAMGRRRIGAQGAGA
jgi:glutamate/tyrosine decarboxylase-like PLP-dependent enzyme